MPEPLSEGLYEHLLTTSLETALAKLSSTEADLRTLDAANLPAFLTRHLAAVVHRALADLKDVDAQVALARGLLERLAELAPPDKDDAVDGVAEPPQLLQAIFRNAKPTRPSTPLSQSTLLTRARNDPALSHELSAEISTADQIDILAAFITVGGVRAVREALEKAVHRGARIRVLTTVFTGTTEVDALDTLARLPGAEVRVSYDVRRTRLHAKAWLFRRATGLHTAYVGSANLTSTALGSGHEWMVKVCAADLEAVIKKFEGTFDGLWNDPEFERYDASDDARARLRLALKAETSKGTPTVLPLFTLRPLPYQQEILDKLRVERDHHQRRRNLLVAATGTGKTVIAAFDYARLCEENGGTRPRLLFVAHRRELLEQALATYRAVLRDAAFGELWTDGEVPAHWDHVFATIQTAARTLGDRVKKDHFHVVVVDECHHAPADSYKAVVRELAPSILLGLTATPERADGKSLLSDFDGRIAAELRLWHALERQLLVPFEYYGVADNVSLRDVKWSRQGYAAGDLSNLYTGHHARVDLIVEQLRRRVFDLRAVRAIAFCVSVEHAEFMAKALSERGVPAVAVHGGSPDDIRSGAPARLRTREVNVLCTCDLYNEGVDLPFVDTLLLLRPTSSATLFMQQIGRGLRLHEKKTSCLVLDFIGQHRSEFRFDGLFGALTGIPRGKLDKAVQEGFPFLPSGCVMHLDGVVTKQVLDALKRAVATAKAMAGELRDLAGQGEEAITLARYLEATGRDVEDVYEKAEGWTSLRAAAGLEFDVTDEERDMSKRLKWLAHVDESSRLRQWRSVPNAASLSAFDQRRVTMTEFQMVHRGVLREPAQAVAWLYGSGRIRRELDELASVLEERVALPEEHYPVAEWPLALHRHYRRREIVAAVGFARPGQKGVTPQSGILKLPDEKREILLVTLDKSASSFSPTTRYKDYAISPTLFHWETQSAASVERASGKRYIESATNGWSFYLFVRSDPDAPYAFLGRALYRSHEGDRPIGITWELEHAMPGALYDKFATLAQG